MPEATKNGSKSAGSKPKTRSGGSTKSSAPAAKPGAPRTRKAPDSEQVARNFFKALAARDLDKAARQFADDVIGDVVPLGIFRGRDELRDVWQQIFTAAPDFEITVQSVVADGRTAVVQWRATGSFTGGSFQGIDPTGRRIDLRGADCIEVDSGKIVRATVYWDGAAFARGIGLMPQRESGAERAMVGAFNTATKLRHAIRERIDR